MSNYNSDNMYRFLGSDGTDDDATQMGEYLTNNGWNLEIPAGENQYHAYIEEGGECREMDEQEWQAALAECFN